jgi:hypothetical protein
MKNFTTILCSLALSVFIYSCGEPSTKEPEKADAGKSPSTTIVNLKTIAGKTSQEVEAILGKAESTEKASPSGTPCKENPCDKSLYQSGKFEIIYINGKADWITINNVSDHALNDKNIELLGLPASEPAFNNPTSTIRWEAVEGINSISFFNNGSGKIDYINIKTATK